MLSKDELARMFPIAPEKDKEYYCMSKSPKMSGVGPWICTRPKDHDGPHVRHIIIQFNGNGSFPIGWVNDGTVEHMKAEPLL